MTRPGIEPRSPGPLANTLATRPYIYIYIYIYIYMYTLTHTFMVLPNVFVEFGILVLCILSFLEGIFDRLIVLLVTEVWIDRVFVLL